MNVEIGTEAPIILFWEYLFQIFCILSLQCSMVKIFFIWNVVEVTDLEYVQLSETSSYVYCTLAMLVCLNKNITCLNQRLNTVYTELDLQV